MKIVPTLFVFLSAVVCQAAEKPNIVFFLVDDLGLGDVGCFGSTYHETPNIDQLCADGMKFTQGYSACTVCSPSRAAILLGKYPARTHLTDWIAGHRRRNSRLLIPEWNMRMDLSETTLPEALRSAGYRSQFVGKWHLMPIGADDFQQHYPTSHGFDTNVAGREWGQPKGPGKYFSPFGMPNLDDAAKGEFLTDALTDKAVHFIETNRQQPFFLYFSYYTVHGPIMAPADLVEKYKQKAKTIPKPYKERVNPSFAAMTELLDRSVGRVRNKLDELGLADNTIIVFTSDNGGTSELASAGLRGAKALAYEGGTRVATMVHWPGVTVPRSECAVPIIGNDFYPTLLEICGLEPRPEQHLDGKSLVPLLKGSQEGWDRDALYWHYPHYHRTKPYGAVRRGDWKLIEFFEDQRLELYDLENDPSEERNLAEIESQKAASLLGNLRAWRTSVSAQMPTRNPDFTLIPKKREPGKTVAVSPTRAVSTPQGTITASSNQRGNDPHRSVDGVRSTRWAANGPAVPQWIQLDFGEPRILSGVDIQFTNRTWIHYRVSVSKDGTAWETAYESRSEDLIQQQQVRFKATARFVRISVEKLGSGWVTISEWKPVFAGS